MKTTGRKWLKQAVDYCWKHKDWSNYLCAADAYLFAYRQALADHSLPEPTEEIEYDSNENFHQLVHRQDREGMRLKKVLQGHFNVTDFRFTQDENGVVSFQGVIKFKKDGSSE